MTTSEKSKINFEMKVDSVCILVSQIEKNPLLEIWFKNFELACSIAVGYRHGWISAFSDEGKLAIEGAFEKVASVLEVSEEELYKISTGK
jgi:hypothetical protein